MSSLTGPPPTTTGRQFEIGVGGYRATIVEVGAGLRRLEYEGMPLTTSYPADTMPQGAQGQLLIPWPNRIDHGTYDFAGLKHHLEITEPERDTAIHGLTRWRPWGLVEHTEDRVRLAHVLDEQPGYPFRLRLEADYRLSTTGLAVTVTATNIGQYAAPYANGAHPYLTLEDAVIDDAVLALDASQWLPTDDRKIPHEKPREIAETPYDFRQARRIGNLSMDYAFTGLGRAADDRSWVTLGATEAGPQIGLWVDEHYPWVEIYTGDDLPPDLRRRGLGVEPMTCPPNGFASGLGVIVLDPGEACATSWGIRLISPPQRQTEG